MTVEIPDYAGCPWPMDPACRSAAWDDYSDEVKARALALASSTLTRLTGGRVSNCPVKVRPCDPRRMSFQLSHAQWDGRGYMAPLNWGGTWSNVCPSGDCETGCEVSLPPPIGRVDEVKVDGVPLDLALVSTGNRSIIWQGGDPCPFPATQDLSLPDTEPGTFSVTYLNAYPVDSNGAYAVGVLALEYGKACAGTKCRLPAGVTTIVRQGVTMEIASGAFPNGLTGIREVDTYIALFNPNRLKSAPKVWFPGQRLPRIER